MKYENENDMIGRNKRLRRFSMPKIAPVSELRNYGQILEMVKPSSPVYLTKNGHGVYSLHSIEDDEAKLLYVSLALIVLIKILAILKSQK